jgi:hypothetical protein
MLYDHELGQKGKQAAIVIVEKTLVRMESFLLKLLGMATGVHEAREIIELVQLKTFIDMNRLKASSTCC